MCNFQDVYMIYAGRSLTGFCIGIVSLSMPVYLAETIHPEVRGTLGLLPTTFGNGGVMLCYVLGTYKIESFLHSPSVMDSLRITNLWLCRFLAKLVLLGPSQRHSTTPISNPHDNYSRNTQVLSPLTLHVERQKLHCDYFEKISFQWLKVRFEEPLKTSLFVSI